ncbi:elongation factor P 5-aminopentanone reductase [Pseudoflavonifractor sp. MSJ-37]|uniref:elongation factor P 5-aminopentanone reductase n=1 Tax=Pseudoflavonifractor sp. MSJ-37 TaxID=2841531 RepID=UPI001C10A1E3|nr:3-oxoacyl-ACP reductase FabG [Pseudoflavonifractor sp. MSJ-37]MBU5435324.1 3-oxoacyl-ACP reductase FabG [Pseudoflavonifractor sp. MSJ-37]
MGGKNETAPRTVLITGASRGIGAACARRFAAAGDQVVVNYHRSEAAAQALVEEIRSAGGTAAAIRADVGDPEQVRAMVDNVLEKFCQLDILICNAGVAKQQLFTDITDQDWRGIFRTDVDGVFYACRAVLPHFIHRKAGSIVTLSSMWGVTGGSCEVAYSAAKAAVIGLTRALAKEVGPSGIRVNCVAPGVIDTEMNGNLGPEDLEALREETPLERIGRPEDVAESVYFLSSPAAGFITGQILSPNGGILI